MLPCSSKAMLKAHQQAFIPQWYQLPKPKAKAKALAAALGIGEAEAKAQAAGKHREEKAETQVTAQDEESEYEFEDSDHPWIWDDWERERLHMESQRVPSCPRQHSWISIDSDALQNVECDTDI